MEKKDIKLILSVVTRSISYNWANDGIDIFPSSKLFFTKDRLDIKYLGLVSLSFLKEDIISIEIIQPRLFKWIKINHKIEKYPQYLVFRYPFERVEGLLRDIESTGFLDKNSSKTDQSIIKEVKEFQQKSTLSPILIFVIISILAIIIYAIIITFII